VVAPGAAVAGAAAVAAPDRHGAEVAERILLEGGNAVDAAIATAFVLAVTFPEAGNLGGGGFMTLHVDGRQQFLDFRETAPVGATRDMYLDAAGQAIPDASLIGALAAGVPGTVAGLWAAHQRYGTLPWKRLVTPAIRLAREGFAVRGDFDPFLGLDGLVQAMLPIAVSKEAACVLVHDHDLAIDDFVLLTSDVAVLGDQGLSD
jgi:gamma-glutamyltranspeptidase